MVVRRRFSNFGSSHRKSALSRTNCLCTFVNCSKLFSKNEIFCFWANEPPSSSVSSAAFDFLIRAYNEQISKLSKTILSFLQWRHGNITCKSCTNNFLKLCRVCSSFATVSSKPFKSFRACSRRSFVRLNLMIKKTRMNSYAIDALIQCNNVMNVHEILQFCWLLSSFFFQLFVIAAHLLVGKC